MEDYNNVFPITWIDFVLEADTDEIYELIEQALKLINDYKKIEIEESVLLKVVKALKENTEAIEKMRIEGA
ncbi:MAG: hypothetical protein J7L15_07530 [Clostridiales bacterium]|nr:hypothetical protein [Clostridiales bacterium]